LVDQWREHRVDRIESGQVAGQRLAQTARAEIRAARDSVARPMARRNSNPHRWVQDLAGMRNRAMSPGSNFAIPPP
jgi:hypothetical protein